MKQKLFILAAVALGLASCSNDTVTEESQSAKDANTISFRSFVGGQTRAADITTDGIASFNVEAFTTGQTATPYFSNVTFSKDGAGTFNSVNKYYWPTTNLDFYAYSPVTADVSGTQKGALSNGSYQIEKTDFQTFTITPSTTVGDQVDFVYANSNNKSKTTTGGVAGAIALNFRHAGAKIVIKVKNSSSTLKFYVEGIKIANVDGSATFTYSKTNDVSTEGTGLLRYADWTNNNNAATASYSKTFTANAIAVSQATAQFLGATGTPYTTTQAVADNTALNMILIPQQTTAATAYSDNAGNALVTTGSYIALKMKIRNNDAHGDDGTGTGDGTLIANATADNKWAMWPVAFNWEPGKQYTYTIDLEDGGYWESNTADGNADLDAILEGAVIKFVSVTVDNWSDATGINVSGPAL